MGLLPNWYLKRQAQQWRYIRFQTNRILQESRWLMQKSSWYASCQSVFSASKRSGGPGFLPSTNTHRTTESHGSPALLSPSPVRVVLPILHQHRLHLALYLYPMRTPRWIRCAHWFSPCLKIDDFDQFPKWMATVYDWGKLLFLCAKAHLCGLFCGMLHGGKWEFTVTTASILPRLHSTVIRQQSR